MSREKELVKNTGILALGQFLPKISSFITLPVLTACLTKAEYGTYDLIVTLVMLAIPIATLQIQSAAFRFLVDSRGNKGESSDIISNIFVVIIPVALVVSVIIQAFFRDLPLSVRVLVSLYFFLDTIHLALGQITRGLGKNTDYSVASILFSIINMVCVVIAVQMVEKGLSGVLTALCAANLLAGIYLAERSNVVSYLSIQRISVKKIKELLAYSWPMVPNNLSAWVLKLSDRLVVTTFLGVEANAVYSVANKIPNILAMAQGVMTMVWQENATIASKDEDAAEYYSEMHDKIFCLMVGCTALLIAGTPVIFRLLIWGDYAEAYYQMPVLILAMFFYVMSSFFGGIYIAHKRTANVGVSTMIAAGVNLAVDLAFVNGIGIWAASISTLAAYLVLYVYRMFHCQRFQPMKLKYGKQMLLIGVLVIMLFICFVNQSVLNVCNLLLGIVIFLVFNRNVMRSICEKLAQKVKGI